MNITHKRLAKICDASYDGKDRLLNHGFEFVKEVVNKSVVAYICMKPSTRQCVIVFRGTDDWQDVLMNIKFVRAKTPFNRDMHGGFLRAYSGVKRQIYKTVQELAGWDIYATGHSAGGALACIYGLQSPLKPKEVVTFGQPRLLGNNGEEDFDNFNLHRYVNASDIVTRIPKVGYRHIGSYVYLKHNGEKKLSPTWMYVFFDSLWRVWNYIKDHRIEEYIKKL